MQWEEEEKEEDVVCCQQTNIYMKKERGFVDIEDCCFREGGERGGKRHWKRMMALHTYSDMLRTHIT